MEEDLKLGKDIEELQKRIIDNAKKIERITKQIEANADKIGNNSEKIGYNTGALEILHTFKSDSNKFFVMWIVTFIALLGLLGYVVYLLNDTSSVVTSTTQEIAQENENGSNNYIGRDGDIIGKAED